MSDVFSDLRTKRDFSLDEISDFSVVSADRHTLLQEAIVRRREFAQKLVRSGVDLDHQDSNGQTALKYALARGESEIAHEIIACGANPNIQDKYGNNALWTAVMNPTPDYGVIEILVKAGADFNHKNKAGRSSSDMAAVKNNKVMLQIFNRD